MTRHSKLLPKPAGIQPELADSLHDWGEALLETRDFEGAIKVLYQATKK